MNKEKIIDELLMPNNLALNELAQQLRTYFKTETNPTIEMVGPSTQSLNIGYGFTPKAWDCYCAIIIYSKHINISFPYGAALNDPKHLLVGSGSRIRHIRVNHYEDILKHEVSALINQARDNALQLANEESIKINEFRTVVKRRN